MRSWGADFEGASSSEGREGRGAALGEGVSEYRSLIDRFILPPFRDDAMEGQGTQSQLEREQSGEVNRGHPSTVKWSELIMIHTAPLGDRSIS